MIPRFFSAGPKQSLHICVKRCEEGKQGLVISWAYAAPSRSVQPALDILPLGAAEVKHAIQNKNEVTGQKPVSVARACTGTPAALAKVDVCSYGLYTYASATLCRESQAESLCCKNLAETHNLCYEMGIRR